MLIGDIVRRNAYFFGDDDAIVVPGQGSTTWAELDAASNRMARAFLDLGLSKGDRVATYSGNCREFIEFFFACAKSGIIGSTNNIRLAPAELTSYLSYVEPSVILVQAELASQAGWVSEVSSIEYVIGMGEGHGFELDLATAMAAQDDTDPGCAVSDDDTYQLGATSGTTGIPKAAVLSHRNAYASLMCWAAELPDEGHSTNLQNIPLFFNPGGVSGIHPVLLKGGRSVIFPAFDPASFLRAVPEYGVTHSILVPTMIGMVLDHPEAEEHDLSSLVAIGCGGSPIPREILERGRRIFGDVFHPMYGMAESYSCGLALRKKDQFTEGTDEQVRRLGSAGGPHLLVDVRVVDEAGDDVPHDNSEAGEIWLRGDPVSGGYFRMPDETAASRSGEWFRTGDLATVDNGGFVTIVDRLKDIIITGGINVFSVEIERVLHAHPAVAQAAVIGVPDPKWGEAIHAVVTLAPGQAAEPEELIKFAAERLAPFKKPRSLEVVAQLPVGGTGKILKKDLRLQYQESTG